MAWKPKARNRAMSLIGPETSEYRRSDQAVSTGDIPLHCYLGRRWVLPQSRAAVHFGRDERLLGALTSRPGSEFLAFAVFLSVAT